MSFLKVTGRDLLGRLRRHHKSPKEFPFAQIPSAPGGASLVAPQGIQSRLEPLLHGMMQASVVKQPGAVFIVGLPEEEVVERYPTAIRLSPTESVGRVSMTPSSAMAILRVLYGRDALSEHLLDLVYLEHAGNEVSKAGPLAMIPPWVKEQLSPEGIYRVFCSPQRADSTVGGALKALQQHPAFSFAMLDAITEAATTKKIPSDYESWLKAWENHAQSVASTLGSIIDSPPLSLQLLPAIRDAQEASRPGVWYFHPEDLPEVAPILDALVLSHGLRQRHHWFVNADAVGKASADGLNALERLSVALWQHRDARDEGYGPALWCLLGNEAPEIQGSRTYKHRTIQASSMIIGDEESVMNSVINSLGVDPDAFDWHTKPGRPGIFYPKRGQFRHWRALELGAIREHVATVAT